MDTSLLRCLRYTRQRLEKSIMLQKAKHPLREKIVAPFRSIFLPAKIPLTFPKGVRFYLPSAPRLNSKSGDVFNELISGGTQRSDIWFPSQKKVHILVKIYRILRRSSLLIYTLFRIKCRCSRLDMIDAYIIIGRQVNRRLLFNNPEVKPLIISDVSPDLHMLWSAAAAEGNRAIWWQDDYHHYTYFPYPASLAVVLNELALLNIRRKNKRVEVFTRIQTPVQQIRQIPDKPLVGVATNGFFFATKKQMDLLKNLKDSLGVDVLYLRLHPNSKLTQECFNRSWISVATKDESLEEYARCVDLVFVGNSAVQLRLVCYGVPVVHISGLDDYEYDLYGYCEMGVVYGCDDHKKVEKLNVNSYYASPLVNQKLVSYVSVVDTKTRGLQCLNGI